MVWIWAKDTFENNLFLAEPGPGRNKNSFCDVLNDIIIVEVILLVEAKIFFKIVYIFANKHI